MSPKQGRLIAGALVALALYGAFATLLAAWHAFTAMKFNLLDYGLTAGAIWNTAHGHFFQTLAGENYLGRHLSFSLALLAPAYWLTNQPFVLSFLQWALAMAGILLIVAAARRDGADATAAAALAVFCVFCALTQNVLLAEFHGIALLLPALPWLYYTARFHPRWTWLPLAVLCGLREDAGLYAAPLLFLLAWRQKDLRALVYGLATLGYVACAVWLIYPAINGISLFVRRSNVADSIAVGANMTWPHMALRGRPDMLATMLVLPFVIRAPGRFVVLCGVPLLACAVSTVPFQLFLKLHYAAPVIASFGIFVAMVLPEFRQPRWRTVATLWLLAAAFVSHASGGFFWPAAHVPPAYRTTNPAGRAAARLARRIPTQGLLVAERPLAAFAAAREQIALADDPAQRAPDFIFMRTSSLDTKKMARWRDYIVREKLGVFFSSGDFFVAGRGGTNDIAGLKLDLAPRK